MISQVTYEKEGRYPGECRYAYRFCESSAVSLQILHVYAAFEFGTTSRGTERYFSDIPRAMTVPLSTYLVVENKQTQKGLPLRQECVLFFQYYIVFFSSK